MTSAQNSLSAESANSTMSKSIYKAGPRTGVRGNEEVRVQRVERGGEQQLRNGVAVVGKRSAAPVPKSTLAKPFNLSTEVRIFVNLCGRNGKNASN